MFFSFFGSYSLDVISSCCFGMDINSLSDPNNEFLKNLQKIFSSGTRNPKFILLCKPILIFYDLLLNSNIDNY